MHEYISIRDSKLQTGGVVRVRLLFNAHLCNHIITTVKWWWDFMYSVRSVRGLGIRMLTLDTRTSLYAEDRGLQVPMTLDHGKIGGTQFCDKLPCRSNGSINYTVRSDVLFVSLNKDRVEDH